MPMISSLCVGFFQLSQQTKKLSGFSDDESTLINELKTQVRRLEEEKETLQNEVQIAQTEVYVYRLALFFDCECLHSKIQVVWFRLVKG